MNRAAPSAAQPSFSAPIRFAVVGAIFAATLALSAAFVIMPEGVIAFRPTAGVCLAAFARAPRRDWPVLATVLLVVALAVEFALGHGAAAAAIAALSVLASVAGAWVFSAVAGREAALESRWSVVALFAAALAMAIGVAAAEWLLGPERGGQLALASATGCLVGAILIAAPLLDWRWVLPERRATFAVAELAGLFAAVVALSLFAFFVLNESEPLALIAVLAPIPLVAWSSVRLSRGEASLLLLTMAVIAVWATAHGRGPISALPGTAAHDILWIQVILAVGSVTTLLLSAAVADARRSEASVQRTAALLNSVIDTSPEAVITIDSAGRVLTFSRAAERLFGYTAEEVVGNNVKMLMPAHFREQHDAYIARYLATGERRIIGIGRVVAGQRKDGTTFPMELSVGEVAEGGQRMFTGFVRDLSEQQRTEMRIQEIQSELFHMSRLSDMGQFASALAHEVNQPLAAIANYSQAARQLAVGAAQATALDGILAKVEQQSDRAAQIIRRLRGFIEKHPTDYRAEDINKVIEEALALAMVGSRGRDTRVRLALSAELPAASIDRVHIQQVVFNLVRNAREAMTDSPRREILITSTLTEGGLVEVAVADTGPGLAPEVAAKLFQPFVTTKVDGMGVGLSICRSIIEAHGGRLWYETGGSGGAVFRFTVPTARQGAEESPDGNGER